MKTPTEYIRTVIGKLFGFKREIALVQEKYEKLLWDSNFGVHSRAGLDEFGKHLDEKYKTVGFIDFDGVRELNAKYGYEDVNRRIKATLKEITGVTDVFVARWFSGDELVVLSCHDKKTTDRLLANASSKGFIFHDAHFTHYVQEWDAKIPLNNFIDTLSHTVLSLKKGKALRARDNAQSGNVFRVPTKSATTGGDTTFSGNILAGVSVACNTGGVTSDTNTVNVPIPQSQGYR
jgi:hypothetical protein